MTIFDPNTGISAPENMDEFQEMLVELENNDDKIFPIKQINLSKFKEMNSEQLLKLTNMLKGKKSIGSIIFGPADPSIGGLKALEKITDMVRSNASIKSVNVEKITSSGRENQKVFAAKRKLRNLLQDRLSKPVVENIIPTAQTVAVQNATSEAPVVEAAAASKTTSVDATAHASQDAVAPVVSVTPAEQAGNENAANQVANEHTASASTAIDDSDSDNLLEKWGRDLEEELGKSAPEQDSSVNIDDMGVFSDTDDDELDKSSQAAEQQTQTNVQENIAPSGSEVLATRLSKLRKESAILGEDKGKQEANKASSNDPAKNSLGAAAAVEISTLQVPLKSTTTVQPVVISPQFDYEGLKNKKVALETKRQSIPFYAFHDKTNCAKDIKLLEKTLKRIDEITKASSEDPQADLPQKSIIKVLEEARRSAIDSSLQSYLSGYKRATEASLHKAEHPNEPPDYDRLPPGYDRFKRR